MSHYLAEWKNQSDAMHFRFIHLLAAQFLSKMKVWLIAAQNWLDSTIGGSRTIGMHNKYAGIAQDFRAISLWCCAIQALIFNGLTAISLMTDAQ